MAISIDTAPAAFCAAKNPVWYRFSTDNNYTPADRASFTLTFDDPGPQTDDQQLVIEVDGRTITLTAKADTLFSATVITIYQFTHNLADTPINDWADHFAEQLRRNHILATYFDLEVTHNSGIQSEVKFILKKGETYTSVAEGLDNCALAEDNNYVAPSVAEEYFSMVVDLYVEDNWQEGDFSLAHTYQLLPANDNLASIDIRKELRPYLACNPPDATLVEPNYDTANGPLVRFYVRYNERYGDPPADQAQTIEAASHAALMAGVRWEQHFGLDLLDMLDGAAAANAKYLTQQPRTKRVSTTQKDYLYFANYSAKSAALKYSVRAYFTDETNETADLLVADLVDRKKSLYIFCIPAGFTQLDVANINPAKTVYKYEILAGTNLFDMEVFTFHVDQVAPEQERIFAIPNSLGAMDILAATGYQKRNLKRTQELIEKNPLFGTVATDAMIATLRDDHDRVMEVSAGPFDPVAQKWLEDLFLTHGQAYELVDSIWVPVIFLDSDLELLNENEDLKTLSFSYQYAYHTENYQP